MATETITFSTTDVTTFVDQIMTIYSSFGIDLAKLDNDKFNIAVNDTISIALAILTCNMNLIEAAIAQMLPIRSAFIDRASHQEICRQILLIANTHIKEKDACKLY